VYAILLQLVRYQSYCKHHSSITLIVVYKYIIIVSDLLTGPDALHVTRHMQ